MKPDPDNAAGKRLRAPGRQRFYLLVANGSRFPMKFKVQLSP
jgi:hypothetical protein